MIITTSNSVPSATITGSSPESGMDNLKTTISAGMWIPDGPNEELTFTFAQPESISYVAGVGPKSFEQVTVTLSNGEFHTALLDVNGCFFFYFETPKTITDFKLQFIGEGALMNVSCGNAFMVPNGGEQGGFNRPWLQSPLKHESVINNSAMPTSVTTRAQSIKSKLDIRNMPFSFARAEWQHLMRFAQTSAFYICEDELNPQSAYICFEPKFTGPQAHGSTRKLARAGVSFNSYCGY